MLFLFTDCQAFEKELLEKSKRFLGEDSLCSIPIGQVEDLKKAETGLYPGFVFAFQSSSPESLSKLGALIQKFGDYPYLLLVGSINEFRNFLLTLSYQKPVAVAQLPQMGNFLELHSTLCLIQSSLGSSPPDHDANQYRAILVASSTGGPQLLHKFLPKLCERVFLPILVVQHMSTGMIQNLVQTLDHSCLHKVKLAKNMELLEPRAVYFAPDQYHMILKQSEFETIRIRLEDSPPEEGCKPSASVLFRSAAKFMGNRVLSLVLTGMGSDGKEGVVALGKSGAVIFAQDESSSLVFGMPEIAIKTGYVNKVLNPESMIQSIENEVKSRLCSR